MLAVNLFHMRGGKIVDKREFFWEELSEIVGEEGFEPGEFFSALLKQVYLDQQYVPHTIYVPVDFEDRGTLEEVLSEGHEAARCRSTCRSAATSARWLTWSGRTRSRLTTSASA